jgi:hypothetical protein
MRDMGAARVASIPEDEEILPPVAGENPTGLQGRSISPRQSIRFNTVVGTWAVLATHESEGRCFPRVHGPLGTLPSNSPGSPHLI